MSAAGRRRVLPLHLVSRTGPALGRVAYEAYWRALAPLALPWARLTAAERRAWQASARAAVRAARNAGEGETR